MGRALTRAGPTDLGLSPQARIGLLGRPAIGLFKDLQPFLQDWGTLAPVHPWPLTWQGLDALAVFGAGDGAVDQAKALGLPVLSLSEGYIRAPMMGRARRPILSVLIAPFCRADDPFASGPAWPWLLETPPQITPGQRRAARSLMAKILGADFGLWCSGAAASAARARDNDWGRDGFIVIADTPGAPREDLDRLLETALEDHPQTPLLILTDRAHGQDNARPQHRHVRFAPARAAAPRLLHRARALYTTGSLAGFTSLMVGTPVVCLGRPFYAGLGLTDDRWAGRAAPAQWDLEQLVHTALISAPRYRHPLFARPCDAQTALRLACASHAHHRLAERPVTLFGVSRGKHHQIAPFLAGPARARVHLAPSIRTLRKFHNRGGRIVIWASRQSGRLIAQARRQGLEVLFMEDGFLRSVGLGRHRARPASVIMDRRGIHFDARRPSDLETMLERGAIPPEAIARAGAIIVRLRALGLSKYNCDVGAGDVSALARAQARPRILVPGQVERDASIRYGSPWIRTNRDLLERVRADNPNAFIAYKPHPDIEIGRRENPLPHKDILHFADVILMRTDPARALGFVDEVHTMTSQIGFEALIMGLKVETYGMPFYAGWGLTRDRLACSRRTRSVSLAELVAASLVLYPLYVDPVTALPCDVEDIIERLSEQREQAAPLSASLTRRMLDLWWALRPTPP